MTEPALPEETGTSPPAPPTAAAPASAPPTPPSKPGARAVLYKGEPLDAERGPGLGCFRFQLAVLAAAVILTPLSVIWDWPSWVSAALLFLSIALLLVAGQTIIFLLRLVAADRRAALRRPLASPTRTVGEIQDSEREAIGGDQRTSRGPAPPTE